MQEPVWEKASCPAFFAFPFRGWVNRKYRVASGALDLHSFMFSG